jgi:hypothetical protein
VQAEPHTLKPKPHTLKPKPHTLKPKPQTPNPTPSTISLRVRVGETPGKLKKNKKKSQKYKK